MLIGGGSGGHITPLLAVAKEIKKTYKDSRIIGICEKNSKFVNLYEECEFIDEVRQISAGKFRRYSNQSKLTKLMDFRTNWLNFIDIFKTLSGYFQAIKLINHLKPEVMLIKGGFVAVPVGLAASRKNIAFITHDSDSTPGLANRIVSRWATYNATGMSPELYSYPKVKTIFTGIPLSDDFVKTDSYIKGEYRKGLGLSTDNMVISVVGGSLGGEKLNEDFASISNDLLRRYKGLNILHVAGRGKEEATLEIYTSNLNAEEMNRIKVFGFVNNIYEIQGAADVVVTRAGATQTAELAIQSLPIVIVPADLAGGHQNKNADFYKSSEAALVVSSGDSGGLKQAICSILDDPKLRAKLASNLYNLAKPDATKEIASLIIKVANKGL